MKILIKQALYVAKSQLGVREIGISNTGPQVNQYLAAANEPPGEPWCASFVYWCTVQASRALSVPDPFMRSGYCPDLGNWAREHGILYSQPEPGDVMLVNEGGDFHHTGFVTDVDGDDFSTIEGNTNDNGSREGTAVMEHQRSVADRYRFVRWADLLASDFMLALTLNGKAIADGEGTVQMPIINGLAYCPVRPVAESLGLAVNYDAAHNLVTVGGHWAISPVLICGRSYVPIKALANGVGLHVSGDMTQRVVNLSR